MGTVLASKGLRKYLFVVLLIVGFILAFASILPIKIDHMGPSDLFIFQVTPPLYWIGVILVTASCFFIMQQVTDKRSALILLFSSMILLTVFRMFFPVTFTSVPAYEPDASNYLTIINSWVSKGIDFGYEGNYQHDYPVAFLMAYGFIKLGVPIETFFRVAPFVIYYVIIALLYLLVNEVLPEDKKYGALAALLFSFSSLGYWVTVHYCPDLMGSMFSILCVYVTVRFAKKGDWGINALLPLLLVLVALILTHHLSTLYFIITCLGLAFSTWFFKNPQIKGKAISFFIIAIFCYTFWFAYGSLIYPSFFNISIYFSGVMSVPSLSQNAGWFNNVLFLLYPVFIFVLFGIEFFRVTKLKLVFHFSKIRKMLHDLRERESNNLMLTFTVGYTFVFLLFLAGFGAPIIQAPRILEILCIGLYPMASLTLYRVNGLPKRYKILMLILLLVLVIAGIYRYDSQIQRRVVLI